MRTQLSCLFLLLAACGGGDDDGGGGGDADASVSGDGGPDTDAAPGTVTVFFTDDDAVPHAGAAVFSSDLDGEVYAEAETDDDGKATVLVVAGGSVTVVYQDELTTSWSVRTMRAVEPGDVIRWGRGHAADAGDQIEVTMPVKAGSDGYEVAGPCGSTSGPDATLFLTHYTWCEDDPYTILATTDEGGLLTGYQHLDGVSLATNPVVLNGTWQAVGSYGVTVSGVPAGAANVEVAERAYRNGTVNEINVSTVPDETDETFTMQHLPSYGQKHELVISFNFDDSSQNLRKMGLNLTGADVEVDASELLPALVGSIDYDAETRTITFPDPGEGWDITLIDAFYLSDEGNVSWVVHGPGSAHVEALPSLPAGLQGILPISDLTVSASLDDMSIEHDWDTLRLLPEMERMNLFITQLDDPFNWRRTYMSDVAPL